ncbi:hypothetical protein SAY86_005667 [Trapa natans]|uniref:Uncharacterized protein n=1 Tax=Trapa natans TaxID=22666 RepID=A0AAN7L3B7_TRANT|nr:hypothetical protein SAY86_005667 [Trapa natans]
MGMSSKNLLPTMTKSRDQEEETSNMHEWLHGFCQHMMQCDANGQKKGQRQNPKVGQK